MITERQGGIEANTWKTLKEMIELDEDHEPHVQHYQNRCRHLGGQGRLWTVAPKKKKIRPSPGLILTALESTCFENF